MLNSFITYLASSSLSRHILQRDSKRRGSYHKLTNSEVQHMQLCSCVAVSVFFLYNWHACSSQVNTVYLCDALVDLATLPSHGDQSKKKQKKKTLCVFF